MRHIKARCGCGGEVGEQLCGGDVAEAGVHSSHEEGPIRTLPGHMAPPMLS